MFKRTRSCMKAALVLASLVFIGPAYAWAAGYRVIYTFGPSPDGAGPGAGLTTDPQGRLYGTTVGGGAFGYGTVFRLTPPLSGKGQWTEEVLHSFTGGADGADPLASVTIGSDGTVYGTASGVGSQSTWHSFQPR